MTGPSDGLFWARVDKSNDCWLWTGARTSGGYGHFYTLGKDVYAHRYAYEISNGPVPSGPDGKTLHLDHRVTCPKNCVNPSHLRPTTPKQNSENRSGAQRNSVSGVRGVYWHSGKGRWIAEIRHNGKKVYVGRFSTLEEAESAVIARRLELFTHNDTDRTVNA